ncbi:patatin-like phospholipase family protein [Myroides odoratimimus]|uniref:patatin-like phospholipase family protein n=1 Tax=Myroides odoratimimus TaxID=76832 RepID=UPI002574CC5B|nr:patatin-like phospholipase family protein [Myroides odoratimimus]MDM1037282.1 patatin-like phospholipase family protein [Myroides odoratimimus]MDM1051359.1 patatin-like phospholipase family protein [Myroides odoratimimus]
MIHKTKIGLVLSGGGYKGIAHAGVLQFLDEQHIKPDYLAGTSAGSIVSSLYARGIAPKEILMFFKSVNIFNWQHFTLKKAGLMDVNAFDKYLNKVFGDLTIGELDIPVYINATDIVNGKLHVFNKKTKVVDAILASSAFPGIFSPYQIGNKIYSDGGIINNFPIELLKSKCDYIIGSNVTPIQQVSADSLTSIRSVTFRAYELMTTINNAKLSKLCDWLIEPKELTLYSTFERSKKKMDEIYDLGYQTAKETFEENQHIFKKAIP